MRINLFISVLKFGICLTLLSSSFAYSQNSDKLCDDPYCGKKPTSQQKTKVTKASKPSKYSKRKNFSKKSGDSNRIVKCDCFV